MWSLPLCTYRNMQTQAIDRFTGESAKIGVSQLYRHTEQYGTLT